MAKKKRKNSKKKNNVKQFLKRAKNALVILKLIVKLVQIAFTVYQILKPLMQR